MDNYKFSNDFFEIIAGTDNHTHPVFTEAVNNTKSNKKSLSYLKQFIISIENLADKSNVKDSRISSTRGDIKKFKAYNDLNVSMKFLKKNLGNIPVVKNLSDIYDALHKYTSHYIEGYEKNIRLVVLEYENGLELLVTGITLTMAEGIEVIQTGTQIKIQRNKVGDATSVYNKTIADFAKQVRDSSHKDYLNDLNKAKADVKVNTNMAESTMYMESSVVADTVTLIDSILSGIGKIGTMSVSIARRVKNSIFGIVPLIRSCLYLRYKKKADTILALEQQAEFIQQNIDMLENRTNIHPDRKAEIIKKQQATIMGYQKKAAKLRAQLLDGATEAEAEIKKENPEIKETGKQDAGKADDDFVLESGSLLMEATKFKRLPKKNLPKIPVKKAMMNGEKLFELRKNHFLNNKKPSFGRENDVKVNGKAIDKETTVAMVTKVMDDLYEKYKKPSVLLSPGKSNRSDSDGRRTDTKIGGIPYWPADKPYPLMKDKPMLMLAQLNLSKLPKLDKFPTSGIMQFFINDFDDYDTETSCMVIYHKDVVSNDKMLNDIPRSTITEKDTAIEGVYYPKADLQDSSINQSMDLFETELIGSINSAFKTSYKHWGEIPKYVDNAIWSILRTDKWKKSQYGCRVGGYPVFMQGDATERGKSDVLLLTLDSEAGMMWGDCGVANFLTSEKVLQDLNFDKNVLFTWDCV